MGDRTYVSLTIHPDDMETAAWADFLSDLGASEEIDREPGNWTQYEVNYAGYQALEALANGSVRFYGDHGNGGDYDAACFFSDGSGEVFYSHSWVSNLLTVPVRMTTESVVVDYEALMKDLGLYIRYKQTISEISEAWVKQEQKQ